MGESGEKKRALTCTAPAVGRWAETAQLISLVGSRSRGEERERAHRVGTSAAERGEYLAALIHPKFPRITGDPAANFPSHLLWGRHAPRPGAGEPRRASGRGTAQEVTTHS